MRFTKIFTVVIMSLFVVSSFGQQALGYGAPPQQSSANNYTIIINSDKESYSLGETVMFSGKVNKYDEGRDLRISIFDSNQKLILTQKAPVNSDTTFSHNVILNEKFFEGEYQVKTQYGNSNTTIEKTSLVINSNNIISMDQKPSTDSKIPDWIKSNAGWWADGQIDDNSFIQGIQFLIKEGLIKI